MGSGAVAKGLADVARKESSSMMGRWMGEWRERWKDEMDEVLCG